MRHLFYAMVVILAGCAVAVPITQPPLHAFPVVPSPSPRPAAQATPGPLPTPTPAPFPLALHMATRLGSYPDLAALLAAGASEWNARLGEEVFAAAGRPIEVEIMDRIRDPNTGGWMVGMVDNRLAPHWLHVYPGALNPPLGLVTVLHELGHVLGCAHSPDYHDVMFPQRGWASDLSPADVSRARAAIAARRARAAT